MSSISDNCENCGEFAEYECAHCGVPLCDSCSNFHGNETYCDSCLPEDEEEDD